MRILLVLEHRFQACGSVCNRETQEAFPLKQEQNEFGKQLSSLLFNILLEPPANTIKWDKKTSSENWKKLKLLPFAEAQLFIW